MKKLLLSFVSILFLIGCSTSNSIALVDLQENTWVTNLGQIAESEASINITAELEFYENSLDIKINPDDVWEMYIEENPEDNDGFTKSVLMMFIEPYLNQNMPISIKENELTVVVNGLEDNKNTILVFDLEKDEDKIIANYNAEKSGFELQKETPYLTLEPK